MAAPEPIADGLQFLTRLAGQNGFVMSIRGKDCNSTSRGPLAKVLGVASGLLEALSVAFTTVQQGLERCNRALICLFSENSRLGLYG